MLELGGALDPAATAATTPPRRRVLVIFNPVAGWRRRERCMAVLRALERQGCEVAVRETRHRGHAQALAAAVRPGEFDVVAAAGGDGTINETANGLDPGGPPLALVPLGTANVLAAEIGLETGAEIVARTIVSGPVKPIHVGRVNGRRFLQMAGIGFDAKVVEGVSPSFKRWAGKGAYVWGGLVEFWRYPYPVFRVTVDGKAFAAASVVIANGHYYAGRYVCAPDARLELPLLTACLFTRPGRWNVLRYATALGLGRLPRLADIALVPGRRIIVEGPSGDPVQADGDHVGALPATIEVARERLRLLHPPGR